MNGIAYTKRSAVDLQNLPFNSSEFANSCTSDVSSMNSLFDGDQNFNQDISHWDVSSVTDMSSMFSNAQNFDQDIGGWDVSNVSHMSDMFWQADAFNQDIVGWNVSNVINMAGMSQVLMYLTKTLVDGMSPM